MNEPVIINKCGFADEAYIARFKDTQVGVYAKSLAEARQRAHEYFRPKKRDKLPIEIELVE